MERDRAVAAEKPPGVLSVDERRVLNCIVWALSAVGVKTFSALGVLWDHRMLLSSWRGVWGGTVHPVDPTSSSGRGVRKAIVLLTDGRDSVCNGEGGHCNDSALGISRTEACTQAKRAGIEVFVVAAMEDDEPDFEEPKLTTERARRFHPVKELLTAPALGAS